MTGVDALTAKKMRPTSGTVYLPSSSWRGLPPTVPRPHPAASWHSPAGHTAPRREKPSAQHPLAQWAVYTANRPKHRSRRRTAAAAGSSTVPAPSLISAAAGATEMDDEAQKPKSRKAADANGALHRQITTISTLQHRPQLTKQQQDQMQQQQQMVKHRAMAAVSRRRSMLGPRCPFQPAALGVASDTLLTRSPSCSKLKVATKRTKRLSIVSPRGAPQGGRRISLVQRLAGSAANESAVMTFSRTKVRSLSNWKQKEEVPEEAKVFVLAGWFPAVCKALEARGWIQNTDKDSIWFDLKWASKVAECKVASLNRSQRCNHFEKATAISTKAGLLWTLRNMIHHTGVHCDTVFPRCFDLNNAHDTQDFLDDFRFSLARSLVQQMQGLGRDQLVNIAALDVVLDVCSKKLCPRDDLDDPKLATEHAMVTRLQWEVLQHAMRCDQSDEGCLLLKPWTAEEMRQHGTLIAGSEPPPPLDGWLQPEEDPPDCPNERWKKYRGLARAEAEHQTARMAMAAQLEDAAQPVGAERIGRIESLLLLLSDGEKDMQCNVNGRTSSKNLWIVKPAAKSRGRGIRAFRNVDQMLHYMELGKKAAGAQWVAQKYIENPMIIAKRKFDIRQWVVVTCWDPLTVWFYNDFYVRFSSADYSDDDKALDDCMVHLANQSVNKFATNFHESVVAENGVEIVECMWTMNQLKQYLQQQSGSAERFNEQSVRQMKEIAKLSLQAAQGEVTSRRGSWELYGYDFMVDDEFNPWLIEVNASPATGDRVDGYSTQVTAQFVPKALENLVKVVVDYDQWKNTAEECRGQQPDVGGWELIFEGQLVGAAKVAIGKELQVQGEQIHKPVRKINLESLYGTASTESQHGTAVGNDVPAKLKTPVPPTIAKSHGQSRI